MCDPVQIVRACIDTLMQMGINEVIRMDCLRWWRQRSGGRVLHANPVGEEVASSRVPRRMPSEYLALYTYLSNRYAGTVVLTFEQMEALLGFALPAQARSDRWWWLAPRGDAPEPRHRDAWILAHRTAAPNFQAGIVVFERIG